MADHDSSTDTDFTEAATPPPAGAAMVPISVETFRKTMPVCDVYVRQPPAGNLKLYRKRSQQVDLPDLDRLAKRGIRDLFISRDDQEANRREKVAEVCNDSTLAPVERYNLLREISRVSFEAAYHSGELSQVVEIVGEMGEQLAEVLSDKDLVVAELFSLMDHDDGTYSHCVNVATYTMLLARHLGISDHERLCAIATGGLLHDIGKRYIEVDVLNKNGKLDDRERKHIEQHPTLGFTDLLPRGDLSWEQLMMVYQHHERFDGDGYPVGLPGREIHELARVTTVADVFHALTSERPYRKPMSVDDACNFLLDQSGKLFDPEIAQCWISNMTACASVS